MKLIILLGALTCSTVINGQTCDEATIDFQTNNLQCYQAFLMAVQQSFFNGTVDNNLIALLCVDVNCSTAVMRYAAACQSNGTVSEIGYLV